LKTTSLKILVYYSAYIRIILNI